MHSQTAGARTPDPAAEQMFIDRLPGSCCLLDEDGHILRVNRAWRAFGRENGGRSETAGVNYLGVCARAGGVEKADAEAVGQGIRAVLRGDRDSAEHSYACHGPLKERWFRMVCFRLWSGTAVMHVAIDAPVEGGVRNAADLFARLAHELCTPLTVIRGNADVIDQALLGPVPECYRRFASAISGSAHYLNGVLSDMLDLARTDHGALKLVPTAVEVTDLLAGILDLVEKEGAVRRVVTHAAPDLPPILCDHRRLQQVLVNLLSNALKYSAPDSAVHLGARLNAWGGLELTVQDSGMGMSPGDLATALTPYGRASSAVCSGQPGLGLGLPLARALVDMHDGTLTFDTAPGRGTTALVMLPPWRTLEPASEPAGKDRRPRSTA